MGFVSLKDFFPEQLSLLLNEDKKSNNNNRILKNKESGKSSLDYAFIRNKKLPLNSYRNILSAMVHFINVKGVTEDDRKEAFKKILNKADYYKICTIEFMKKYEQYVDDAQNS